MSFSELISPLIGRLALAWFFLSEVYTRASDWDGNVSLLTFLNMPAPPVLLALALIVMVLGGLSLLLGFHARHGAILLFGFTVLVSIAMLTPAAFPQALHMTLAAYAATGFAVASFRL